MHDSADVLIVDDEVEIVNLIFEVLSEEGYRVRTARDGLSAIKVLTTVRPALVLLDYSMPGMTGGEVLAHLRSNGYTDLPVVIMSASSNNDTVSAPGATDFLEKPFDLDDLVACVERYLRS